MGYQLNMLTLCAAVADEVTPNSGLVLGEAGVGINESVNISGGKGLFHFVQTPETTFVQTGARPRASTAPLPARSAGCCNTRIAFGLTGLLPGAVGGVVPRANPNCNHSIVTGFQFPVESLYSTRR